MPGAVVKYLLNHIIALAVAGALAIASESAADAGNVAAGAASIDSTIPRCDHTFGDIAIHEGTDQPWHSAFQSRTNMGNISPLLRNYVLQSNCFRITSQGVASERAIQGVVAQNRGSDFRPSNKHGPNQRVGANFYMEPTVNFSGSSSSVANIGGFHLPGISGLPFRGKNGSAEVTLEIYDTNAGVLVASATGRGKASQVDIPFTSPSEDPDARAVSAAILDAYRQLIPALNNYVSQKPSGGLDVQ